MPSLTKGKTNWKYILIVLILALIVVGGVLIYLKDLEKEIVSIGQFPEIKKVEKLKIEEETFNWKTYRYEEYGFEFKYPDLEPTVLVLDCDFSNFPLKCPRIVEEVIKKDLPHAIWVNPEGEKITINGTPWCLYETGEGATGRHYVAYYYTTVKNNKCLTTLFVVEFRNCGVYIDVDEKEYKKCEEENNMKSTILNRTVSTFNFFK
jgi:hypothetical protein